jgi:nitrate reductase delta subunit
MSFLNTTPKLATKTLRVLARLLSYPDPTLRKHLPELRDALRTEAALSSDRLQELEDLIDWMSARTGVPPRCTCSSMCMATHATGARP